MHPDADALLDAIFDSPDDDTPRLVYADWLQEHDQEDFARFLRLSIAWEQLAPGPEKRRLHAERKSLWTRIRAVRYDASVSLRVEDYRRGLLDCHFTSGDVLLRTITGWRPAITPRALSVDGARGFGIRSREAEVISALGSCTPWLRELELRSDLRRKLPTSHPDSEPPLDGSLFEALTHSGVLPRLRCLYISSTTADVQTLRTFARSERVGRLDRLIVAYHHGGSLHRFAATRLECCDGIGSTFEDVLTQHLV